MLIPNEVKYSVLSTVNNTNHEASIVYANEYNGDNIASVFEYGERFDVIPSDEHIITKSNLVNKTYTYTYDSFNRLISESFNNNIINYEYGPISQMIEKVYNNNVLTKEFNYSNGKLISYKNGNITNNISYDKIGNIISIGTTNYTYNDRGLLSSVSNNTSVYFSYNYEGIRVSKETSEKLVKYYTDGHNIIGEDWIINNITTKKIRYFYNSEGICGIRYNGKNYHLIKDSLGNINKIMYHGLIIGEYNYDAWGNVSIYKYNGISIDDSFVIDNNPFRYKGYYYDTETNLYYLINRYYSPDIYIFISPDSVNYLDIYRINGLNQYCYCYNNPVMYADPNGNIAFLIVTAIIGAAIGFGIAAYKDYKADDKWFNGNAWSYVGYTLGGAAIGAIAGAGISGALTGSFISSCSSVKAGAVLVYQIDKAGGFVASGYAMLDNLSNAFHNPLHVFWSGGDIAKEQSINYAERNGGITLEMTRLGQYLETKEYNSTLWNYASQNFANQVSKGGTVRAILYYPEMRLDALWFTENEILVKRLVEIIVGSL